MLGINNLLSFPSLLGTLVGNESTSGQRSVDLDIGPGKNGLSFQFYDNEASGSSKLKPGAIEVGDANDTASDGPSALTKASTLLKNMTRYAKDATVAILGGLIILAGIYLIIQSFALLGVLLILAGGYMILRAYESWSAIRLLDTAKTEKALKTAQANTAETRNDIVPAMNAVNQEITEAANTGKEVTTQMNEVVETVSDEILAAREEAEKMMQNLQYSIQEMDKVHHGAQEAMAPLHAGLRDIEDLTQQGQKATDSIAIILQQTQTIQKDPSKLDELNSKFQKLNQLQQEIKHIFGTISLKRSRMEATINELEELEATYYYNAETFEKQLTDQANAIKTILEKTGGEMSVVDQLVKKSQSLYKQTFEKAGESKTLIDRTKTCSDVTAKQLSIVEEELRKYKENLIHLQWICASGAAVGNFVGRYVVEPIIDLTTESSILGSAMKPLTTSACTALGARYALPVYTGAPKAYGTAKFVFTGAKKVLGF